MKEITQALLVVAVLNLTACMLPKASEKDTARQKASQGALVIDVRNPDDYEAGHYSGATNIPLDEIESQCDQLGDRSRPVVVYCYRGMMAASAKSKLMNAGFTDVANAGGYSDLRNK